MNKHQCFRLQISLSRWFIEKSYVDFDEKKMKSDLAFFEKKKLTVMKSNDGKYENKRFKSSRSHVGRSPILSFFLNSELENSTHVLERTMKSTSMILSVDNVQD